MKKKYKPCEVCKCGDCEIGAYREGSWWCPFFKKQICSICCQYDMTAREKCKSLRCEHLTK